ncbi:MAG: VOC family protein [Arenimonas sp.]
MKKVFINLPVKDLKSSKSFFEAIGFSFEPKFTNDMGACMVVESNIFVMLLTEDFFKTFTSKKVANANEITEAIICLSCGSKEEVDDLVRKVIAAGGTAPRAAQDHGFMYQHGFEDMDGHIWELAYMPAEQ